MTIETVEVDSRILASREFREAWQSLMGQKMPYAAFRALNDLEKSINEILVAVKDKVDSMKDMDQEDAQEELAKWFEEQEKVLIYPVTLHADKTMILTPPQYRILSSVIVFK